MTRAAHAPRRSATKSRPRSAQTTWLATYLDRSQTPLLALLFVLPMLILHEIGVREFASLAGRIVEYRIAAFVLMTRFFQAFGASGRYLPALAVVAILLSWHIARRDHWRFNFALIPIMAIESIAWAVPLIGVYLLFSPDSTTHLPATNWKLSVSLYLGAGVYEELIFRLAAFAALSFLFQDIARLSPKWTTPFVVLIAAIMFSGYHMLGLTAHPWQSFVFIGLRGIYYGIIFIERGFGLSVGTHTAYDLIYLLLTQTGPMS
jgi:hypothetical protein